ncbi:hypothetical protein ACA910_019394 [Epithemia clementina (nom. ined.)]
MVVASVVVVVAPAATTLNKSRRTRGWRNSTWVSSSLGFMILMIQLFVLLPALVHSGSTTTAADRGTQTTPESLEEHVNNKNQKKDSPSSCLAKTEDGVCVPTTSNNATTTSSSSVSYFNEDPLCDVYFWDYWLLAGRDMARHELIAWSADGVHVPFHQQSRAAWPRWSRYHYLLQVPNQPHHYWYKPGLAEWPLECHASLYNVVPFAPPLENEVVDRRTSFTGLAHDTILRTDRPVQAMEALFQDCEGRVKNNKGVLNDLDLPRHLTAEGNPFSVNQTRDYILQSGKGFCLDNVLYQDPHVVVVDPKDQPTTTKKSSKEPKWHPKGVWAKRHLKKGATVTAGKALHMHRAEFWNADAKINEELIAYTYGHKDTDLLVLPMAPIFSSIRSIHMTDTDDDKSDANVILQWDTDEAAEEVFTDVSQFMFGSSEENILWVKIVALRDIVRGEPLLLDYTYAEPMKMMSPGGPTERNVPYNLFPLEWLADEERAPMDPVTHEFIFPKLALPQLKPGQLHPVELIDHKTGDQKPLASYIHRVGLPDTLADTMESWAREIGVLEKIQRYVVDKTLPRGDEERFRVNGATWWTRRFDSSWRSNMHYVAVDDDLATKHFFEALHRGQFDTVLQGIGEYFNLTTLTCFYPTYIVVNHCVQSYMHSDSDHPGLFNLLFAIVQHDDGEPELVLGEDPDAFGVSDLHAPYVYERSHAVIVGKDGMHGTAPTDYRDGTTGTNTSHRVVLSVYMADFTNSKTLRETVQEWADPPYPNYWPGQLEHVLSQRVHWRRSDHTTTKTMDKDGVEMDIVEKMSIASPMPPNKFPMKRNPAMDESSSNSASSDEDEDDDLDDEEDDIDDIDALDDADMEAVTYKKPRYMK